MLCSIVRALACLVLGGVAAAAQAAESSVPYVPTPQEVVDRMLTMAKVGPGDYVIDLGSGDGRIVVTAAKQFGARGFGVDLNPARIKEAVENAAKNGVSDRAQFYQRNLFDTDLGNATVITMYLLPRVNMALRPKLLELKPGTRIVSHDFDLDDWRPDDGVNMDVREKYGSSGGTSSVYFWIVPAKVAGVWQWELSVGGKPQRYELALEQTFQIVTGVLRVNGGALKLTDVRLRGDQIGFSSTVDINGAPLKHAFSGRVAGGSIDGTVMLSGSRSQSELEWNAARGAKSVSATTPPSLAAVH